MSQPVYRYIGQLLLDKVIHKVSILVFGIVLCAGPAAKIDLCSGSLDIQRPTAGQTFFFYIFQDFILYLLKSYG